MNNIHAINHPMLSCEKISSIEHLKFSDATKKHTRDLFSLLKHISHSEDYICTNFILPREWGKIDCILLCKRYIIILKIVKKISTKIINELIDSCLDLSYFHVESRKIPLIPVVLDSSTLSDTSDTKLHPQFWHNIAKPFICSGPEQLYKLIKNLDLLLKTDFINIKDWEGSSFTPIIHFDYFFKRIKNSPIAAKMWLHRNVIELIGEINRLSQEKSGSIIIINGIPGSGKTIVKNYLEQILDKILFLIYEFNIYKPIESCLEFDRIIKSFGHKKNNMTFICILNEYLSQKDYIAHIRNVGIKNGLSIEEYSDNKKSAGNQKLFLSECIRIFRSSLLFDFWSSVLLLNDNLAKQILKNIPQNNSHRRYRILLSRNLKEAKHLLHSLKHGSEKIGIISSNLDYSVEFEYAIFAIKSNFVDYISDFSNKILHNSTLFVVDKHLMYSRFITLILKARQGIIIYIPRNNCRFDCLYSYLHEKIGIKNINETPDILELTQGVGL